MELIKIIVNTYQSQKDQIQDNKTTSGTNYFKARFSLDSSFFIVLFLNDFKLVNVGLYLKILKLYDSYLFLFIKLSSYTKGFQNLIKS